MPKHAVTLAVGHLQTARRFFKMCSLCFNWQGRMSKYM